MKLLEELLAYAKTAPPEAQPLLLEVGRRLEQQRAWRQAWLDTEIKVDQLTRELELVRSRR